jgi:hypothetical protein
MFALAIVCAILSGWTSAVAQAQDHPSRLSLHDGHGTSHADHPHGAASPRCTHAGKCLHPMLCSACFAVQVMASGIERGPVERTAIRPLADLPLTSLTPQPAPPPPKRPLSTG